MTKHAAVRAQQRAIPQIVIDLLREFGRAEPAGKGASKLFFDKRARRKVETYAGPLAAAIDEHLGVFAVVGPDDKVITVGHLTKRINRH
ncbi:hypothetical protein CEW83_14170 [Parazoarcus communis]|uniref:DUF4258 domain-containing protein n=2 Tax=Parazoarcus communis TaxID=41977 RepID=A0A2U8GXN5_9RHOO|nr:hypothetical protein CEW83_14170 [Parazoarcus communis]